MTQPIITTSHDSDLLSSIQGIQRISLNDGPKYTLVDSTLVLSETIDKLEGLPVEPPSLYVDLEGINVSRYGTISVLQLHVHPEDHTYLIDVHQFQERAFSTTEKKSDRSLKAILEAKDILKVFFDVRNNANALFFLFQISLSGVIDIQLMELAKREYFQRYIYGLIGCIRWDAPMTMAERMRWTAARNEARRLFAPEKGGRYETFNDRPLEEKIINHCVQNVQVLPRIWSRFNGKITASCMVKVRKASEARILSSQSEDYNNDGNPKAEGSETWCFRSRSDWAPQWRAFLPTA